MIPYPIAALAGILALAGCQPQTRIIRYNPMLGRVPGAVSGMPVVATPGGETANTAQGEPPETRHEDGSVTLRSRSFRDVMRNTAKALLENDPALFVEQVLSQRTRDEYAARGLDPAQGFATLAQAQPAVKRLFSRLPMGEGTPGTVVQSIGKNAKRLTINGAINEQDAFVGIDAIIEDGHYRLRWLVPAPGFSPEGVPLGPERRDPAHDAPRTPR